MGVEIIEREGTRSLFPSVRPETRSLLGRLPFRRRRKSAFWLVEHGYIIDFTGEKDLPLKYVLHRLRTVFIAGSQVMQR